MPIQHKIYPEARRRMIDIWHYTDKKWGEQQADKYIRGIYNAIEKASESKYLWRKVEHEEIKGIFYIIYQYHHIFFRELSEGRLGVVNVLHSRMDIPSRLKESIE
ncbi:Toxin-antitoxin system, toxin component, RelE/ParE-like [Desulfonema limicola]|uniref:Toxin-antitoxin system, toxin component, RelE/ParE-like n=1 Tax=Desulfonema limicola TaxID=45656 RepID=A0A975BCT3_9BACT|nr:type II toxin-antitoxin system RelE/ParE family toxin [Desulfonema limicola]QTA82988.1 Toxin-antitoxin system, toxin component, RelE/ParE-like [Desulfonema limicola]